MKQIVCLVVLAALALAGCAAPGGNRADAREDAGGVGPNAAAAEAGCRDLTPLYDRYVARLVPTGVVAGTWSAPEELPLDELLVVYQIDVIHPNRDAYDLEDEAVYDKDRYAYLIDAQVVEEYVQRYFGVDQELMRTCDGDGGRYRAEQGVYEIVSGLGGAWEPRLAACAQEGDRLDLYLEFLDEAGSVDRCQVLTVRVDGEGFRYLSNVPVTGGFPAGSPELMSDEDLVDRALYLFDPYVNPVSWWAASGTFALGVDEFSDPLEDTPDFTVFHPVWRFDSVDEVKRATEQVVTMEMAQKLYRSVEELPAYFLERNGRLYLNTEIGAGAPPFGPVSATVVSKSEDEALLSAVFVGPYGEEQIHDIELVRENGIWKLNHHPFYDWL